MKRVIALSLVLVLGGCLEWVLPGDYGSRGYAGPTDPLTLGSDSERAKVLDERFRLIQAR